MMEDNLIKLRQASYDYRLNYDYEITENLLSYIQDKILTNKVEI